MFDVFDETMETTVNEEIFDWDAEINYDDKSSSLLPPGEYDFEVISMERGWYDGSAKLPACNQAILKLKLTNDNGQSGYLTDRIKLCQKLVFKISAFFKSIGLKKEGEAFRMDWRNVPGSTGRVLIEVSEIPSQFGPMQKNQVKKYLPKQEAATFTTE